MFTDNDFECAISLNGELVAIKKARFYLGKIFRIATAACSHAEIVNAAALTLQPIFMSAINYCLLVKVVRVICAEFDRFMGGPVKNWKRRVIEFHIPL